MKAIIFLAHTKCLNFYTYKAIFKNFRHNLSFLYFKELLPPSTLRENAYIAKSVRLEQFIMEGSYNKVFILLIIIWFNDILNFPVNFEMIFFLFLGD